MASIKIHIVLLDGKPDAAFTDSKSAREFAEGFNSKKSNICIIDLHGMQNCLDTGSYKSVTERYSDRGSR